MQEMWACGWSYGVLKESLGPLVGGCKAAKKLVYPSTAKYEINSLKRPLPTHASIQLVTLSFLFTNRFRVNNEVKRKHITEEE